MGVNRIVMQNGVVWWLPPLRPKDESRSAEPRPRPPRKAPRKGPPRRTPQPPRDAAAAPPAGFVPLSSLGIPGLDSLMLSHGDFYRDAYESAVRALPGTPDAPNPPVEPAGESGAPVDEPNRDAGPEADQSPRRAA